jgi:hypothetical protein
MFELVVDSHPPHNLTSQGILHPHGYSGKFGPVSHFSRGMCGRDRVPFISICVKSYRAGIWQTGRSVHVSLPHISPTYVTYTVQYTYSPADQQKVRTSPTPLSDDLKPKSLFH